ncbi:MAG: transglycosylase domain-containing protein, partial [Myxococcota bacterium]
MSRRRVILTATALATAVGVLSSLAWLRSLDAEIEARFRGRLFAIPSRVYSAPLLIYPGLDVQRAGLIERLHRLNYHVAREEVPDPGEYAVGWREIEIGLRPFRYSYGERPGGRLYLGLDGGSRVRTLRDARNRDLDTAEIEPELIAEFHGASREDRRLVRLEEVPPHLIEALLSIEDRRFYEHRGVLPSRILGAALANLRAGRIVQGGSTLTQQLVKNFYLSSERTLSRKLREAVMALLLERRHGKREILETYLNEVYMGQRGSVAIHGMGEAAHYYFAKEVSELTLAEAALLAGIIKGPALYSPYLHPERARERRNLVLDVMLRDRRISPEAHAHAREEDLGVRGFALEDNSAPYFVSFLRQDLAAVYGEEILAS